MLCFVIRVQEEPGPWHEACCLVSGGCELLFKNNTFTHTHWHTGREYISAGVMFWVLDRSIHLLAGVSEGSKFPASSLFHSSQCAPDFSLSFCGVSRRDAFMCVFCVLFASVLAGASKLLAHLDNIFIFSWLIQDNILIRLHHPVLSSEETTLFCPVIGSSNCDRWHFDLSQLQVRKVSGWAEIDGLTLWIDFMSHVVRLTFFTCEMHESSVC